MKVKTQILSKISELDEQYNAFNGSKIISNDGHAIYVWRAQKKPDEVCNNTKHPPTFPYITVTGSWNYHEYLGIYIEKDGEKPFFHKYTHEGRPAEDPRLYTKKGSNDVYMEYTSAIQCNMETKICVALWEINLTNLVKSLIDYKNPDVFPVQICSQLIDVNNKEEKSNIEETEEVNDKKSDES